MTELDIDPQNPLMVGFKIEGSAADTLDSSAGFMERYVVGLHWLWTANRASVDWTSIDDSSAFLVLPFPLIGAEAPGACIVAHLSLLEAGAQASKWRLHFRSNPAFGDLALEDRITLADLQRDALALLSRFEGVGDIDYVCLQIAD